MYFSLVCLLIFKWTKAQYYPSSCSLSEQNSIRLYNTYTGVPDEGSVQICRNGNWDPVCDYYWNCNGGDVACRQLGYSSAGSIVTDSRHTFGYWYNYNSYSAYSCSGSEDSLSSCTTYSSYCYSSHDYAGVRCINENYISECEQDGTVRLINGTTTEGILQYCYNGNWSFFCAVDTDVAAVACKQLGFTKYAVILSAEEFSGINTTYSAVSLFDHLSCSSTAAESSLSECSISSIYSSGGCADDTRTCNPAKAIGCYNKSYVECTDGEIRLMDGSISQEGRVEVCVDGIWGTICGDYSWYEETAYVVCKQLGFVNSEPVAYYYSHYGGGSGPIWFRYIYCQGWQKSIFDCSKSIYPSFTCSSSAGVLCQDDCTNGEMRLIGGESSFEGTVELCHNKLWGLISDAGWDEADAMVICRQLNLPYNGSRAIYNSYYGKPDRTIHYSYVLCSGQESKITKCNKIEHSLSEGRKIYEEAAVAGVVCDVATPTSAPPPCIPLPNEHDGNECTNGQIQLMNNSIIQYCIDGYWSGICHMTHNETTVACAQLGYEYKWGLPFSIDTMSSSTPDTSLIANITCTSNEDMLRKCTVNKAQECQKICDSSLGLYCYEPGDCTQGAIRLTGGLVSQEGRVEVCIDGVWGSICDNGWDKTDAHVVCKQLGYATLEPFVITGDVFGPSTGPLLYSDVDCGGWEESILECNKRTHLEIDCSHKSVASVMCLDGCADGDVRLVYGPSDNEGTVEVCYDDLWGLIQYDGWKLESANVVCRQLGYGWANNATSGSLFGIPNIIIHISNVNCDGSEHTLSECTVHKYTLSEGRNMALSNVPVAGVICHTSQTSHTSTSSKMIIVNTTTNHVLSPPSVANNTATGSNSSLLMVLVVLVSIVIFLIIFIFIIVFIYCVFVHKSNKRRSVHPHVVTLSQIHNKDYDLLDDEGSDTDENVPTLSKDATNTAEEDSTSKTV